MSEWDTALMREDCSDRAWDDYERRLIAFGLTDEEAKTVRERFQRGDFTAPYSGPARDGIEAQHGLNDTYPGDPYP